MNEPVKPGDKVFVVRFDLGEWDPGYRLIYKREVWRFETGKSYQTRILATDSTYIHQWFLTEQEAKEKILEYIKAERKRLNEMESLLNEEG